MGNREALLAGAKRCLSEKGYARTTARDIAAAAGTSLAAIGYHFRSTEALLNAALMQAIGEWGDELGRSLAVGGDPQAGPMERFEAIWTRMTELFATHRQLLYASFEAFVQSEHVPEVRQAIAAGLQEGRLGLAELFHDIDPAADEKKAWAVGSFYQALLSGLFVQWLVDPQRAPSGHDLADALRVITADVSPVDGSNTAGPADPVA